MAAVRNTYLSFRFSGDHYSAIGGKCTKCCIKVDHKYTKNFVCTIPVLHFFAFW